MSLVSKLIENIDQFGFYAFSFIVVLTIIVFVHELGHYAFARLFGVDAEIFSLGFGKKLVGFRDKRGTLWQIAMIPLGGFLKLKGEDVSSFEEIGKAAEKDKSDKTNLESKSPWQQLLIVFGGPAFNIIFAFLVLLFMFSFYGKAEIPDKNHKMKIIIESVGKDSIAEKIGIRAGDEIIAVNDKLLNDQIDLINILGANSGRDIKLEVIKFQSTQTEIVPAKLDSSGKIGIQIKSPMPVFKKVGFLESIIESYKYVLHLIKATLDGIVRLFTTKEALKDLGGMVQIAKISGGAIQSGFVHFLFLLALLSINLGIIINLIPIPSLDGGRIVLYALDMLWIGRFINQKIRMALIGLSFFLLMGLMLFANLNDLRKFFE